MDIFPDFSKLIPTYSDIEDLANTSLTNGDLTDILPKSAVTDPLIRVLIEVPSTDCSKTDEAKLRNIIESLKQKRKQDSDSRTFPARRSSPCGSLTLLHRPSLSWVSLSDRLAARAFLLVARYLLSH